MLRVLPKFSNQNIALAIFLSAFFALTFAGSVESAQNRNQSKSKTSAAAKKETKPTPSKKAQAKATPTPKKSGDKKDKRDSSSKSAAKNDSKNKKDDRAANRNSSKNAKANEKTSAKQKKDVKQTRDAKQKNDSSSSSSRNARNSRSDDSKNKPTASKSNSRPTKTSERNSSPRTADRRNSTAGNETKSTASTSKTTKPKNETPAVSPSAAVAKNDAELPQIIVSDMAARVRRQAKADAPEVSRLKLGTVLKVTEKNSSWYRVKYAEASGKAGDGWISANSVNDMNGSAKEELYRQIVNRHYKSEMDFAAASEMVEFLTAVNKEIGGSSNSAAEMELKRLLALRLALRKIPAGQSEQAPYQEFLKTQEKSVVFSEPSGEWHVASNRFWDLHKKFAAAPIADQIAWEAAQNPLPGECEGYVNCYLFAQRMTFGEYLRLHPTGAKAVEALKNLTDFLEPIAADASQKSTYTGPTDVTDRAEFNNLIAELRIIVSRLPLVDKEKALRHLKQIAEAYR